MNQSYAADVALEPIIWIVDNYAHFLGRVSAQHASTSVEILLLNQWIFESVLVFRCLCGYFNIRCCIYRPLDWTSILVG